MATLKSDDLNITRAAISEQVELWFENEPNFYHNDLAAAARIEQGDKP